MDAEYIKKSFGKMVPDSHIEYCHTFDELSHWLRRPIYECFVAVLIAADREELSGFLKLKDLLSYVKLILIVPDQDDETLTNAHKLRPRFLSFSMNDFSEAASVLAKMIEDCNRPLAAANQTKC
jgi:hypothetical protein